MEEVTPKMVYERLGEILRCLEEIRDLLAQQGQTQRSVNPSQFRKAFDRAVAESTHPTGWSILGEVEALVTEELSISVEAFERLFRRFIEENWDLYELSPGGRKQYVVKGRYYGLIRPR